MISSIVRLAQRLPLFKIHSILSHIVEPGTNIVDHIGNFLHFVHLCPGHIFFELVDGSADRIKRCAIAFVCVNIFANCYVGVFDKTVSGSEVEEGELVLRKALLASFVENGQ